MKKQILELLKELETLISDDVIELQIWTDYSGVVSNGRFLLIFSSEEELIQGLKNKIKELKK